MTDFIGRGEERTTKILKKLFPDYQIKQQVPIKSLLGIKQWKEFSKLGDEYTKHKCDIVLDSIFNQIVIEVNYKHGKKAEEKWKIYKSYLEDTGNLTVTIDDKDCESLFQIDNGIHTDTLQDHIDVIRALQRSEIN